jgi:hypothetical protein
MEVIRVAIKRITPALDKGIGFWEIQARIKDVHA